MSVKVTYETNSDGCPSALLTEDDVHVEVVGIAGDDMGPVVDSIALLAATDGLEKAALQYLDRGQVH
jgi:hypothetical protein